jgi:hypothetical protein
VGLKYNSATQAFEWASGEEFTYAHWAEFEPGQRSIVLRDLFQQNGTNFLTPEAEFMNVQFRWGF